MRQLTLIFLGAVGVCALFFALGYLVGVNGRPGNTGPVTEQVPPPSEIPPTVNPPAETSPPPEPERSPGSQSSVIEQNIKPSLSAPSRASMGHEVEARQQRFRAARQPSVQQAPTKGVMIQVAASHTEGAAVKLVKTLRSQGYRSVLITPQQAGLHDHIYRVQVGPYGSRPRATSAMHKLSQKGFHPFIKE